MLKPKDFSRILSPRRCVVIIYKIRCESLFSLVISLVIKIFNDSSIKFDILVFNMESNLCFYSIEVLKVIIIIIYD